MNRKLVALAVAATTGAGVLGATAPAYAYGPSYCNSSSCDLAAQPYSGYIYFQMPRGTAETMLCWTDTQYFRGSVRWFKVSTIYGVGYSPANEVSNQTRVGHC